MEQLGLTQEPDLSDSAEGTRILRSFERVIDNKLSTLKPAQELGKVLRMESGGLEFYYQREIRESLRPYFTIKAVDSNSMYEFGLEEGSLVRRVLNIGEDGLLTNEDEPGKKISLDEAKALLVVMKRPKAFTRENPPGFLS